MDQSRNKMLASSIGAAVLMLILFSTVFKGVAGGYIWSFSLSLVYYTYTFIKKDAFLMKIIYFSLVAGFVELLPDHWLVHYTETLFYPDQIKLYSSPLYMPFAWSVVLIQLGYIGWLLFEKYGNFKASIAMLLLGAIIIPTYEHWAINAGWWHYENTSMIFSEIPYYIIFAEGILMITIPTIFIQIKDASYLKLTILGIIQGLVMWLACIISWFTVGIS